MDIHSHLLTQVHSVKLQNYTVTLVLNIKMYLKKFMQNIQHSKQHSEIVNFKEYHYNFNVLKHQQMKV